MESKYHTREGYERLYFRLCEEAIKFCDYKYLSDFQLLCAINTELMNFSCVPFTQEELEMELH